MIKIFDWSNLQELFNFGEEFFTKAREVGEFNRQSFINFWLQQYKTENGLILVNENEDGTIDAMLGMTVYPEFLTGNKVASELFWYSTGRKGLDVLKKSIKIAVDCGCRIYYLQHLVNENTEKMKRFYTKTLEFEHKYERYVKEL